MERHEVNLAVGTIMPLEQRIPECDTLVRTVLNLQSWRNRMPSDAELAAEGGAK